MSFLSGIKNQVAGAVNTVRQLEKKVEQAVQKEASKVGGSPSAKAPAPPPPPPAKAQAPHQKDTFTPAPGKGTSKAQGGGGVAATISPEAAVANNSSRRQRVELADIRKNPDAFLRNVSQLDGDPNTKLDEVACGPTSMLMGMVAARPESVVELARKLMGPDEKLTPMGRQLLGAAGDNFNVKDALISMRNGKFSPAELGVLGDGLYRSLSKGDMGTTGADLLALRARISRAGVSVPKMELQLFGAEGEGLGHWRVEVNGKQYNPWPDSKGQGSIVSDGTGLEKGKTDGKYWIVRERLTVDDAHAERKIYQEIVTTYDPVNRKDLKDPVVSYDTAKPLTDITYALGGGDYVRQNRDSSRFHQIAQDEGHDRPEKMFDEQYPLVVH